MIEPQPHINLIDPNSNSKGKKFIYQTERWRMSDWLGMRKLIYQTERNLYIRRKDIYIPDGKMDGLLLFASSSRCEWRVLLCTRLCTQDILGPCTQDRKHDRADQRHWYRVADSPAEFSIV